MVWKQCIHKNLYTAPPSVVYLGVDFGAYALITGVVIQKPGMSRGVLCSVSLWKTGASYVTFVPHLLLYQ